MRFIKGRPLLPGLLLLAVLFTPFRAGAEDAGLAGDRGGLQQVLLSHCLSLEAVYTGEFVRNLDPGLVSPRKDTIYQDNLDLTATLDTEAAGLWSGGTAYISGLFNHGGFPTTTVIGDLQAVSNIEAAQNQFIVFEAWYEHTIDDLHLSL
ncbi:MAG: carbohydrate porin, partial [Zetaproteobacteria bacterium CG_4_8_14_3_um_filter_59_5]